MLEALKRWLSASRSAETPNQALLRDWADRRGLQARTVRGESGVVVDGPAGAAAWRLEWGPAQRSYIDGFELRLRADLGFGTELQALVMNRRLQEAMERAVFDQYVEGVQTRIDDNTPPEMRWLVMFPKLTGSELGALREGYAAVGNHKSWLVQWLDGPLSTALATQARAAEQPLVLMVGRGRIVLRTQLDQPDGERVNAWLRLFETAMREAGRVHSAAAAASRPPADEPVSALESVSAADPTA
jgi:hypothetical protein